MFTAHKIRLYPTKAQEALLKQHVDAARFVYNWTVANWTSLYEQYKANTSSIKPNVAVLSALWKQQKPVWIVGIAHCVQTHAIMNAGDAFKRMLTKQCSYPKFHKKGKCRNSFYVDSSKFRVRDGILHLPNIGDIKLAESVRYDGHFVSCVVSEYAGIWYAAIRIATTFDVRPKCKAKTSVVGVDVGLKHIAMASDKQVLDMPKSIHRLEHHAAEQQRRLSNATTGSHNYWKQLKRLQRIRLRIQNIKQDAVHKFTTRLAKNHGVVVLEDLDIEDMIATAETKVLRRSLAKSLMSELQRQLAYKAETCIYVPRNYPSSRLCSKCGNVRGKLALTERVYKCEQCGLHIDRDLNAALNLKQAGMVNPGVPVRLYN